MNVFGVQQVLFSIGDYPVSYVEFIGTLFGLVSVYLASRANILTWPTGIINELSLFILFFQVQLYADMALQVFFFITTLYGWHKWNERTVENKISRSTLIMRAVLLCVIIISTLLSWLFFRRIHILLPFYFPTLASYPFADSLIMVLSIVATFLLAKKKIESWYLWIVVDAICVVLYFKKHIYFLSAEYFVFLAIATYGYFNWNKQLKNG